ncbi:MAG: hypothetical protein IJV22_09785 [Bacteroidales bacterium]|nr:hypothetical protein [Bacteroidales bacterium]
MKNSTHWMRVSIMGLLVMGLCMVVRTAHAQSSKGSTPKVVKIEERVDSLASKHDDAPVRWKLYRFEGATMAAYTIDGKQITPPTHALPFYCGGGLWQVFYAGECEGYNSRGEVVLPRSLGLSYIFHQGDGLFKVEKRGVRAKAVYNIQGECIVPFEGGYSDVGYRRAEKRFCCRDSLGVYHTVSLNGASVAPGSYDLSKSADLARFNAAKRPALWQSQQLTKEQALASLESSTMEVRAAKKREKLDNARKPLSESVRSSVVIFSLDGDEKGSVSGKSEAEKPAVTSSKREEKKGAVLSSVRFKVGDSTWVKVSSGGCEVVYDSREREVLPFSSAYSRVVFVPVEGHVGYFRVRRGGKWGACAVSGDELVPVRYGGVSYTTDGGFKVSGRNPYADAVYLDVNGAPCSKEYKDVDSRMVAGDPNVMRLFMVAGDRRMVKYVGDSTVWTNKETRKKGYTNMFLVEDPMCIRPNGDTVRGCTMLVVKGKNVGVWAYWAQNKELISPDRGYTGIVCMSRTDERGSYYVVEKNGLYGVCDQNGKEIVPLKWHAPLAYNAKNGFYFLAAGKPTSIGVFLDADNKPYKSYHNLYDSHVEEGDRLFAKKSYSDAADEYKKALHYHRSSYAYYNMGASLYNEESYKKAAKAFEEARLVASYEEKNKKLASQASDMQDKCNKMVAQRRQQRWEAFGQVMAGALVATAVVASSYVAANYANSSYGSSPYGSSSYSSPSLGGSTYHYGDGADAAIANANRIMAQSERRMQYEFATAPQRIMQQTQMQMAAQQAAKEAQWRQEYENYRKNPGYMLNPDGSLLSWEEYKQRRLQIEAQAYADLQQEQRNNGGSSGSTYDNSRWEHIKQQNREFYESRSGYKDCPFCSIPGNGKCRTCNGTGMQDEGFGLDKIPCANCKSDRGKCSHCRGTGKVLK